VDYLPNAVDRADAHTGAAIKKDVIANPEASVVLVAVHMCTRVHIERSAERRRCEDNASQ